MLLMLSESHRKNLIIISIFLVIITISFYDIIFLGKTFKVTTANPQALTSGVYGQRDNMPAHFAVQSTTTSIMEEPIYEFIKQSLKKGIFPLWNPHQGCGYPLIGMMQHGFFWPLNWILYLFPQLYAWDIMILARFLLAGILTFWFMRSLGFTKIPSFGSAIIFMLSGPMVVMQYNFANVDILTPLLLITFDKLRKDPNMRSMCIHGISISLTFLAGHPEHIVLVNGLGLLFFIFRIIAVKPRPKNGKIFIFLIGSYILGLGLSAIAFFPFLRNWLTEFWHTHPETMGARIAGEGQVKEGLLALIIPHFFQAEPVTLKFARSNFWGYIGTLPIFLAFLSLFSKEKKKLSYFFAFIFIIIFAKNYINSPTINWIGYLPVLKNIRFFFHVSHLLAFAIAICAGIGINFILTGNKVFIKSLALNFAFLGIIGWLVFQYKSADHFQQSQRASLFSLCVLIGFQLLILIKNRTFFKTKYYALLLLLFIGAELFLYIPREHVKRFNSYPKVPYIEMMKKDPTPSRAYGIFWTLYPNTATGYRIDDLGINQGLLCKRLVQFVNEFLIEDFFKKDFGTSAISVVPITFLGEGRPYFNLINQKYTIANPEIEQSFPRIKTSSFLKPFYNDEVKIFLHPNALPRAFIIHKVIFESKEENVFKLIKTIKYGFNQIAVIHHTPITEINDQLQKAPFKDNSTANITKYSPNEIIISANMQNPGFLVLGDLYHPDWKAFVDGKETQIFITNYLIRSVFLPKGEHVVRFVFRPKSFYLGASVSGLFLIFALVILIKTRDQ